MCRSSSKPSKLSPYFYGAEMPKMTHVEQKSSGRNQSVVFTGGSFRKGVRVRIGVPGGGVWVGFRGWWGGVVSCGKWGKREGGGEGGGGRGGDRQRNRQVNAQALSKLPFSDLPFSFSPKSARFPCQNANLPHWSYFTHIQSRLLNLRRLQSARCLQASEPKP